MQDPWKRMNLEASAKQDLSRIIRNSREEEKELKALIQAWAKPKKEKRFHNDQRLSTSKSTHSPFTSKNI